MASTYEPISTVTTASNATTVTFSSIPQTYTDLVLIEDFKVGTQVEQYIRFNSDSSSLYSRTFLEGYGSGGGNSSRQSNVAQIQIVSLANETTNIIHIMNYSNTTTYKTLLARFGGASAIAGAEVGLYRSTSAISSINISLSGSNFVNGSTFTLYGIKAA